MSGYDFFSGFLGNLSDQMKEKEARQKAIEDEERQYQRVLSREEAVAKSRERLQIAAEERQRRNAGPKPFQKVVNGKTLQGQGFWNAEKNDYDVFGELAPVMPTFVREVKSDGRVKHLYSDGSIRDMGESETMSRERGANARSANSIAAANKRAELSASSKPQARVPGAAAIDKAITAYNSATPAEKLKIERSLGVIPGAQAGSTSSAVEAAIRAQKAAIYDPNAPRYVSPAAKQVSSELDGVANAAKSLFGGKKPVPDIAAKIAEARKRYVGGDTATEQEILEAIEYEKQQNKK
jgi:hypothetical protein